MKKRTKLIILAIVLVVVLAAGIALYNFYPMLAMRPAETGSISGTSISAIRNSKNAVYLVDTGSGYILVDTGSNTESLQTSLDDFGISAKDVKWILLTHSDYDHVASLPIFPNAVIYMSEDEMPLLDGTVKRNASGGNKLPDGVNSDKIILVKEGQELTIGGKLIKCIETPGHTVGSMTFLIEEQYLFTGDAFMVNNEKMNVHPYTMNEELASSTIEDLKETVGRSQLILTGHYGYFEGGKLS